MYTIDLAAVGAGHLRGVRSMVRMTSCLLVDTGSIPVRLATFMER